MSWVERAKRNAARKAVKEVRSGYVVGLGTGSTAAYAIQELGRRIREESLRVLAVPTSYQAKQLAVREKISLTTLDEHELLDISIDGVDQLDGNLDAIKGGGAALTREKIVGYASRKYVFIADRTKLVKRLGVGQPVPIEVLPFALPVVLRRLRRLAGKVEVRQASAGKAGPVVTDNGNLIVDAYFGHIRSPSRLERNIKDIPGIVECGLFVHMAHEAFIGYERGEVRRISRGRGNTF